MEQFTFAAGCLGAILLDQGAHVTGTTVGFAILRRDSDGNPTQ